MRARRLFFRMAAVALAAVLLFSATACAENEASDELFVMDTYVIMSARGNEAQKALEKAADELRGVDRDYSVSALGGEIEALLRTGEIENPSEGLIAMLTCAKTLWERTDGAYDVTAYALSEIWGFYGTENRVPTDAEITAALQLVGMDKIEFDGSRVRLNGVKGIDLGSIAKGYSGSLAQKAVKSCDVKSAVLTLGGNVVTVGAKSGGGKFKVGVTDPAMPSDICGVLEVGETHVVTSGKYNRNFTVGEKTYHHIIDARTGYPCENGVAQVTVICDDGMLADGLSTALFLLGEQGALDYYTTYGGFEAVIVMDDGRIVLTDGAKAMFTGV